MKTSNYGLFAVAVAIAFVGALSVGVPLAGVASLLILLACPLMMIFMMKGMHRDAGEDQHHDEHNRHDPSTRR